MIFIGNEEKGKLLALDIDLRGISDDGSVKHLHDFQNDKSEGEGSYTQQLVGVAHQLYCYLFRPDPSQIHPPMDMLSTDPTK